MSVIFKIRDVDHPDYDVKNSNQRAGMCPTRLVTRKGQEFEIGNGEIIELFKVSVLAEAIDRSRQTILLWEKAGKFPKSLFETDGKKRRLYSKTQIINLHNLIWGKYQARKNQTLDLDKFLKDVRDVFYSSEVVVDENGRIQRKNL